MKKVFIFSAVAVMIVITGCTKNDGQYTQNPYGPGQQNAPTIGNYGGSWGASDAYAWGAQANLYKTYQTGTKAFTLPSCTQYGNKVTHIIGEGNALCINIDLASTATQFLQVSFDGQLPDYEPCILVLSYVCLPNIKGTPCNPKMLTIDGGGNSTVTDMIASARELDEDYIAELNTMPEDIRYAKPYKVTFGTTTAKTTEAITKFQEQRKMYEEAKEHQDVK